VKAAAPLASCGARRGSYFLGSKEPKGPATAGPDNAPAAGIVTRLDRARDARHQRAAGGHRALNVRDVHNGIAVEYVIRSGRVLGAGARDDATEYHLNG
jgi:hypothetical protein